MHTYTLTDRDGVIRTMREYSQAALLRLLEWQDGTDYDARRADGLPSSAVPMYRVTCDGFAPFDIYEVYP